MRCYTCKKHKFFLLSKGLLIESPLFFVRGATRVKSIIFFARYNVTLMGKKN
jgi:hypothetical protein